MSTTALPFPEWDGTPVRHLTVAPNGTVYSLPSGAHERLHEIVIGDRNPTAQIGRDDLYGTKVDLALAGWAQLQSDQYTNRLNIDAPDGYDDDALVRRFARCHDAGMLRAVFYPSTDELKNTDPQQLSFSRAGDRVPITLPTHDETDT
jgi:hypothetical protein